MYSYTSINLYRNLFLNTCLACSEDAGRLKYCTVVAGMRRCLPVGEKFSHRILENGHLWSRAHCVRFRWQRTVDLSRCLANANGEEQTRRALFADGLIRYECGVCASRTHPHIDPREKASSMRAPRNGLRFTRAQLHARILPSMPRSPKPPGTRTPLHITRTTRTPYIQHHYCPSWTLDPTCTYTKTYNTRTIRKYSTLRLQYLYTRSKGTLYKYVVLATRKKESMIPASFEPFAYSQPQSSCQALW